VNLASAGSFAILSKAGITDVPRSAVTGDVGTSPITGSALGLTCPEVTGTIYTANAAGPACKVVAPARLTTNVGDLETAYNDAAGRTLPDFVNEGAGEVGGLTLRPGLHKWTSNLRISTDVTLSGGPDDVFIMQIAGSLTQASAMKVTLAGGAQAKNVFWQTGSSVAIRASAHFEGTILSRTLIAMKTNASINGRLLAQTAVTLQMNNVTVPAL
jgi:hypothetical protein